MFFHWIDNILLSICSKKDEVLQRADFVCSRDFSYLLCSGTFYWQFVPATICSGPVFIPLNLTTLVWWSIMFQELFSDHFYFPLSDGTNASINLKRWLARTLIALSLWSLCHSYSLTNPFLPISAYQRELGLHGFRRPTPPCAGTIFLRIQSCNDGVIVAQSLFLRHLIISAFASICRSSLWWLKRLNRILVKVNDIYLFLVFPY